MDFTIKPDESGDFIEVTTAGDITREDAVAMAKAMHESEVLSGISCFLIDATRSRNVFRPLDNARLATEEIPSVRDRGRRGGCVALLVDPNDHSHDFYAAIAHQQGIDTTLFTNREEAVEYLLEAAPRLNRSDAPPSD